MFRARWTLSVDTLRSLAERFAGRMQQGATSADRKTASNGRFKSLTRFVVYRVPLDVGCGSCQKTHIR